MNAFITYDGLPISSGGAHHLSGHSPRSVYASISEFLSIYTDNKIADSVNIELLKVNFKNIVKYSLKYGIPRFNGSNFSAHLPNYIYWLASTKKVDQYINDTSHDGNLNLCVMWRFKFVDLKTAEPLSGQTSIPILDSRNHNSQLYLRTSYIKSTISAWFAFPFDNLQNENLNYIKGIESTLPFKFSKSSWRLWELSKNNKWIPRKISME